MCRPGQNVHLLLGMNAGMRSQSSWGRNSRRREFIDTIVALAPQYKLPAYKIASTQAWLGAVEADDEAAAIEKTARFRAPATRTREPIDCPPVAFSRDCHKQFRETPSLRQPQ